MRARLSLPRIGHSGTLDPMATGLLLLCAGAAARLQGFFTRMDKTYEGTIRLGRVHDDLRPGGRAVGPDRDATGVQASDVAQAAGRFRGEFLQAPPPYSAKKVGGRKLYELARKGESVAVEPKKVRVTALELGDPARTARLLLFHLLLLRHLHPLDRQRARRDASAAARTSRPCAGRESATSASRTPSPWKRSSGAPRARRSARRTPCRCCRFPSRSSASASASLEAWKLRKGQSIPLRQVAAREGDWVTLVGPGDEMVALGQVAPIGHGGVSLVRPKIVLEGPEIRRSRRQAVPGLHGRLGGL